MFRSVCQMALLSAALGLAQPAVAAAPAAETPALAAFHPAIPWAVKALLDKPSGLKICTVSTKFNNGFFLQMTAAQEGINSISLNFRQGIFARGATANVGIAAPGVIKKVLPAMAFKPELLAIDFEGQGELFEAVKNAGVMDFSMGPENRFRFYLNGLTAVLPRFAQCMKTHASPGAGVDIPVPVQEVTEDVAQAPARTPEASPPVSVPAIAAPPSEAVLQPPVTPVPVAEIPVVPPVLATPALEVIASPPPAEMVGRPVSRADMSELAPKGPPNAQRAAMAVSAQTAPSVAAEEATTLRSANIDQETGRAPPPPPRRLSEIEPPPVFTNAEPIIGAPSAEAIAKSKAAMERYQQEMGMVMPEEAPRPAARQALATQLKAPAKAAVLQVDTLPMPEETIPRGVSAQQEELQSLEPITPEGASVRGVLDPGPRRPAIRNKRLTQMLAEDMQRQYEEMGDDGRLRPDIRQRLEQEAAQSAAGVATPDSAALEQSGQQYELKPLVAPLVKRGTAEEKALADILGAPAPQKQPSPVPSPMQSAPAVSSPVPVIPQSATGLQQPSPILRPDSQLAVPPQKKTTVIRDGVALPPPPGINDDGMRVHRQSKSIEADLTHIDAPPTAADVLPPRQGKSWLDILREKQEEETAGIPAEEGGISGVYVPDGAAAPVLAPAPVPLVPTPMPSAQPAFSAPISEAVEVDSVPALAPRRKFPPLTRNAPQPLPEPLPEPLNVRPAPPVQAPAPILRSDPAPRPRMALSPTPPPALSPAIGEGGVLAKKIAIMEQQLATLTKENVELEAELANALEQGKQEKVAIESENWNLEQSTSRYQEATRQIDRLGAQVQKERAQCTAEKKELEAMLFDPQVTQEAQLARLAELEDALNEADRKLEAQRQMYEGRIQLLQSQVGAQ